jgi:hypothetical protein
MNRDFSEARLVGRSVQANPRVIKNTPRRLVKRKASYHQRQIQFLTVLFGTLAVSVAVGILWLLNK